MDGYVVKLGERALSDQVQGFRGEQLLQRAHTHRVLLSHHGRKVGYNFDFVVHVAGRLEGYLVLLGVRSPKSQGFVENSFYNGLTYTEFFFHTKGGR